MCVGGKTEPSGWDWGGPEQALGDKSDERRCHVGQVPGLHAPKYGCGGGGVGGKTTTLHSSTWDGRHRQRMKTQLVPVRSHRQLMKRRARGGQEPFFWHGRSDGVMWGWSPCTWHILPICGFGIIWNSKEIQRQFGSLGKDAAAMSAPVFEPLITTPHQACLHIVHRWQRWSLGWRPPKPELFIFCEGGKKNF